MVCLVFLLTNQFFVYRKEMANFKNVVSLLLTAASLTTSLSELITHNNVIFHKNSEITISRHSWKLCYVIDLSIYDIIFGDSLSYINVAINQTNRIINTHKQNSYNYDFSGHYVNLLNKLINLNFITK